jgi:hypothetical protein
LLGARALRNDLRDRFDVDWFRNPRAWVAMRTEGTQPAFEPSDHRTPVAEADALARAFEEALG